jgi:PEP-CTERM motif
MRSPLRPLIPALALALLAGHSTAQTLAGSLAGWAVVGDVVAQGGAIVLTTAYAEAGNPDQPFNLSGSSAAEAALVEAAAGLPVYALDLSNADFATEGSLVTQSLAVAAGDRLSFSWSFGSADVDFLDHAFAVIDGQLFTLATTATPGLAAQTFEYTFAAAGTATLALGVVDTGDYIGVSTLSVSGLAVTAVPEPATSALWLAGLGLLGAAVRRRR